MLKIDLTQDCTHYSEKWVNFFVHICIMNILNDINTMSCPIENNSNTIELTVHTSCYWVLDLLCVIVMIEKLAKNSD